MTADLARTSIVGAGFPCLLRLIGYGGNIYFIPVHRITIFQTKQLRAYFVARALGLPGRKITDRRLFAAAQARKLRLRVTAHRQGRDDFFPVHGSHDNGNPFILKAFYRYFYR